MAITTMSSREFNQRTSEAKRAAAAGPVFITERGRTAHVLLTIEEYGKITGSGERGGSEPGARPGKSIIELLAMPGDEDVCDDFDSLIPRSRELPRAADFS